MNKRLIVLASLAVSGATFASPNSGPLSSDLQARLDQIETIQITADKRVPNEQLPAMPNVDAIVAQAEAAVSKDSKN